MRFAVALVTLLLAGVLVAVGIAQRTVWKPADHVTVSAATPSGARYVVIPGSVLRAHGGQQRLRLAGSDTVFAAYGKTSDVTAWLAGQRYTQLRVDAAGAAADAVARTAPRLPGVATGGAADPDGSDLWMDQRTGRQRLDWTVNVPSSVSLLVASDGTAAAPGAVQVTWPLRTTTPLALPMIIAGGALAVLGLLLYIWALIHVRRRRGPRRKAPPKMPRMPQPPKYRPAKPAVVAASRGRRRVLRSSTARTGAPRVLLAGLGLAGATALLTGCGAMPAPAAPAPTPTAAARVVPAAVTEEQATRIVHRVADVAAAADAKRDAVLLRQRFDGPALQLREAAYRIRAKDTKAKLPQAIPTQHASVRLILPESTTTWPRTLFAVVEDTSDTKVAPLALTLVQAAPRADYLVHYEMSLQPNAKLPDLPSAVLGGARLAPDAPVLKVAPQDLAKAYGTLLRRPDDPAAKVFDVASDDLVGSVGLKAKQKIAKALGSTAKIRFEDDPTDPSSVIAMSTALSGALVSVNLDERWTVQPKRSGVMVTPSGATKILSRTKSTGKGIASVYAYQLLFSVPSAGSKEPVVLLGYAQGLVSAKEL